MPPKWCKLARRKSLVFLMQKWQETCFHQMSRCPLPFVEMTAKSERRGHSKFRAQPRLLLPDHRDALKYLLASS